MNFKCECGCGAKLEMENSQRYDDVNKFLDNHKRCADVSATNAALVQVDGNGMLHLVGPKTGKGEAV